MTSSAIAGCFTPRNDDGATVNASRMVERDSVRLQPAEPGAAAIWAKALRLGRSSAQRRRNQKWLFGKMIFVDSGRLLRFREKMLRHWSPWRAARPVYVERLFLVRRGAPRLFEIPGASPLTGL